MTKRDGRRGRAAGGNPGTETTGEYAEFLRAAIGERWAVLWEAIPRALAGEDIEGVHDVRVASRRLRAAMDVAEGVFPDSWHRPLRRAAKEITGALGEVRDRDVLITALERERDALPPEAQPGAQRLIDRVERERQAAREQMEAYLRDLLEGDLPDETTRRYGPGRAEDPREAGAA